MTFFYHGQERACLWFNSPNHCATFCGMLLAGIITYASRAQISKRLKVYKKGALYFGLILLTLTLILTYSRGGWLAYLISLTVYTYFYRDGRKLIILYLSGYAGLLLILPQAINRVGSLVSEDPSIYNRLNVWRGAVDIIASHPLVGIGNNKFCYVYTSWFEPLSMTTRYWTSLNNYLTIGAELGLPILVVYLFLLAAPIALSYSLPGASGKPLTLAVCMSLLVYIISSCFTYNLNCVVLDVFVLALWAILLNIVRRSLKREYLKAIYSNTKRTVLMIVILCLVIYGAGLIDLPNLPTKIVTSQIRFSRGVDNVTLTYPQKHKIIGIVAYFQDKQNDNIYDCRKWLRPLSENGFITVSLAGRAQGMEGLAQARALLQTIIAKPEWQVLPIFIIGTGEGGQIAMLSDCLDKSKRVRGIVALGASCAWPFDELSPDKHVSEITAPLLLLQSIDDTTVSIECTDAFCDSLIMSSKSVKLLLFKGVDRGLDEQWHRAFGDVLMFLDANSASSVVL